VGRAGSKTSREGPQQGEASVLIATDDTARRFCPEAPLCLRSQWQTRPIGEAALWGLVAGSSLLIGAVASFTLRPSRRAVGLLMGFGSGVLISAVAYELVGEAFHIAGGSGAVAGGVAAGALTFYFGDLAIARQGGGQRKAMDAQHDPSRSKAIVLGTVLDGIPESIVIGLSLIEGGDVSVAVIAAVFLSNLPEAVGASTGLERTGIARERIYMMWAAITAISAFSAALGFGLFDGASEGLVAFTQAFAGGALLTMLASTMLPEAFEKGGREVGLLTVLGFAVAFAMTAAT
jgi:zinc transporter, ZIP family